MPTRFFTKRRAGFTLIELAIVLGVVGVMSAGIWRLMSVGSQQTRDQATAQQQAALISAVKGFLAGTTGQAWITAVAASTASKLYLPNATWSTVAACQTAVTAAGGNANNQDLCNYLPTSFYTGTTNPYGQGYNVQVLKDSQAAGTPPLSYSFMVATSGGTTIPDVDGGRISGSIGGDGGFIYTSTAVCGASQPTACGALGAWIATTTSYGYGTAPAIATAVGHVTSRTYTSSGTDSSNNWLERVPDTVNANYLLNQMVTDLFMGTKLAGTVYSGSATSPALHLQTGYIDGNGPSSTTAPPQISITATNTAGAATVQLVRSPACTLISTANCPASLAITGGDVAVVNGGVFATKLYSTSDVRLKTAIHSIDDPLGNLMKLAPIAFTFKEGGSQSMGVTAQDLEKVYPQLVTENHGVKMVEYNGLIGPMLGAIQELKRENDSLRVQIHAQALKQEELERKLKTAP